jgi:hypothetical protein
MFIAEIVTLFDGEAMRHFSNILFSGRKIDADRAPVIGMCTFNMPLDGRAFSFACL